MQNNVPQSPIDGPSGRTVRPVDNADDTGLPLLRTWPAVYAFVLVAFVVFVVVLSVFTFHFTRADS
jgi:hypothetical protein